MSGVDCTVCIQNNAVKMCSTPQLHLYYIIRMCYFDCLLNVRTMIAGMSLCIFYIRRTSTASMALIRLRL